MLDAQLAKPYFPVDVSTMKSMRSFREVTGGEEWEIEGTKIRAAWLNHPQGCLGYRLDTTAGSIVYATDNEPGVPEMDENLRRLADGADVLIYDAQYSPEQLASNRKGWGHSSWLEGVKIAREAKVGNLVLFHHDPDSSSRTIDGFLSAARQEFPGTWAAMEGMSVNLSERGVNLKLPDRTVRAASQAAFLRDGQRTVRGWQGLRRESHRARHEHPGRVPLSASRPRLQSELRVVIEATGDDSHSSVLSLRGAVVYCETGREKNQNGVGVVFVEDSGLESPRD